MAAALEVMEEVQVEMEEVAAKVLVEMEAVEMEVAEAAARQCRAFFAARDAPRAGAASGRDAGERAVRAA